MPRDRCSARDKRPDAVGGANRDAAAVTGLCWWLEDTISSVPEIEAFGQELAGEGAR